MKDKINIIYLEIHHGVTEYCNINDIRYKTNDDGNSV